MHARSQVRALLLVFCTLPLSSCSDEELRERVARFDRAVQQAGTAVRQKYVGINDVRRTAYLTQVRLKPGTKLENVVTLNGRKEPTGLVKYYSDSYIQSRLLAFQALTSYTEGLALMASSDAPARAEQALKVTGERVAMLGKRIEALNPDPKAAALTQFATPIARLAGLASEKLLQYLKDKNLKTSLLESEDAVQSLSQNLIDDLNEVNSIVEGAEWASILARYRSLYNQNNQLLNGTYLDAGRTSVLKDVEAVAKRYADLGSGNPAALVMDVKLAHDSIIDYLNANKKRRSKEEFVTMVEADLRQFESDAAFVADAASRIESNIRQGVDQ